MLMILFSFFFLVFRPPPRSTLFPYTTLFRSISARAPTQPTPPRPSSARLAPIPVRTAEQMRRSEEHTSELQSQSNLVCRLLLEKKKKIKLQPTSTPNRRTLTCPTRRPCTPPP